MSELHDEIKGLLPLRETLASRYNLEFKRSSKNWVASCPFHIEKTPSFTIHGESEESFHCYGCGEGGDLFTYIEKIEGLEPSESLKKSAEWAGVSLGTGKPPSAKRKAKAKSTAESESRASKPAPKPEKFIQEDVFDKWCKPLTKKWSKRLLLERGWSEEIIKANDIRLYKSPHGYEKVAIPIRDDEDRLVNIRLYQPGAKEFKIISWYDQACIDCGGAFNKEKQCKKCGKDRNSYGDGRFYPAPRLWPSDDDGWLWITEGEQDRLCGASYGLDTVTHTTGCATWKKTYSKALAGRRVVFIYDNDNAGYEGAWEAAESASKYAREVRILSKGTWPAPMAEKEDLTDWFVTHKKTKAELEELLNFAEVVEAENEEENNPNVARFFSSNRFIPAKVTEEILENTIFLADPLTDKFYKWDGCYFREYNTMRIEATALDMLGHKADSSKASNVGKQVFLKSLIPEGREINDHLDMHCFKNGMLDISTGVFHKHDPKYLSTQILEYDFDKEASCPRWITFLEEVIPDKRQQIQLQQFFGYCLTRETRYQKALILVGPGEDGKSVILKLLTYMVGAHNCSAVQMSSLTEPFERATLFGKLLNIATEEDKKSFGSAMFKAIVSGDFINASFKHENFFQFEPYCKLAFSSNFLPNVQDSSHGFYRRILGIEFTRQFLGSEADKYLEDNLRKEIAGIFKWAYAGLMLLKKHDGFIEADASSAFIAKYKQHNNPALLFFEECCEIDTENSEWREPSRQLYRRYVAYAKDAGNRPMNEQNFGSIILGLNVTKGKTKKDGDQPRSNAYIGIKYLPLDPAPPDPSSHFPP